ncbi:MAG: phosphoserine phosphatase SerB [Epsilonproteobacteria bacterium]|nr:phosphoserine phosphatase SerB [Campylobacterota bacterium]
MKLAVFDFDSTLMDGETIDFLAKELGLEEEVAKITELAMQGELDFFDSLVKRVSLLKGLEEKRVNEICQNLPIMPGAFEAVKMLKENDFRVVCFSGGFRNATKPISKKLNIDADFANYLHAKNGILTGQVGGEMMFGFSKGEMIQRLQKLLNVSKEDTLAVGDGANDASMFEYAGVSVAFCAKDVLKKVATDIVDIKDLKEVAKVALERMG